MNLRELTIEQQQILDAVENGDFTPEQVADHLDGITQAREEKIEGCLHVLNQCERKLTEVVDEVVRLQNIEASIRSNIDRIKGWLLSNMEDGEKHEYPLFKISKVRGRQTALVTEWELLDDYITEEITEKLDRRALLSALKNGAVDGAEIIISKSSLRIN